MRGPYLPPGVRRLLDKSFAGPVSLHGNGPRRAAETLQRHAFGAVRGDTFEIGEAGRLRVAQERALIVDGIRLRSVEDPAILFWAKVEKTSGCWFWRGTLSRFGYGKFQLTIHGANRQRTIPAHRYSFEMAHGRAPSNYVLHKCDRPACVRPDHLFEGTQSDNCRDAIKKKRWVNQRLTVDAVRALRQGASIDEIARQFGCAVSTARCAAEGRSWKWI